MNKKKMTENQNQKHYQQRKLYQKSKISKQLIKTEKDEIIAEKMKKQTLSLIRNCWVASIYKKKEKTFLCKERFVNFLTKEGKKSKAYKVLIMAGILTRKKLLQFEKKYHFFANQTEVLQTFNGYSKNAKTGLGKVANQALPFLQSNASEAKSITMDKEVLAQLPVSFGQLLQQAIENVKPSFEVRKVRVRGTTYLVPAILRKKRQETLAIKWLIDSARIRKGKSSISFAESLSHELLDALKKQGQARQKRDELHKLAQMNRAYTRYRWW